MRVLQPLLKSSLPYSYWLLFFRFPTAASSAAIRAYDDVHATTKDFSGQSLMKAEFNNAKLENANFSGADLRGVVFNGAVLTNANLHGANLSDGIGYLSDLSGADLGDAILTLQCCLSQNFRMLTGQILLCGSRSRTGVATMQIC